MQGASDEAVAEQLKPTPDDPEPLTEDELAEREELLKGGFSTWNRRDFNAFVRACEKVRPPCLCLPRMVQPALPPVQTP